MIRNCPQTEYPKPDEQDIWCEIEDPDYTCHGCAFDDAGKYSVFDDAGVFWSSSVYVNDTSNIWGVHFDNAGIYNGNKATANNVVCVR